MWINGCMGCARIVEIYTTTFQMALHWGQDNWSIEAYLHIYYLQQVYMKKGRGVNFFSRAFDIKTIKAKCVVLYLTANQGCSTYFTNNWPL